MRGYNFVEDRMGDIHETRWAGLVLRTSGSICPFIDLSPACIMLFMLLHNRMSSKYKNTPKNLLIFTALMATVALVNTTIGAVFAAKAYHNGEKGESRTRSTGSVSFSYKFFSYPGWYPTSPSQYRYGPDEVELRTTGSGLT